jgi:hypothetical protein
MFRKHRNIFAIVVSLVIFLASMSFLYAMEPAEVQVGVEKLSGNLYMLPDSGGSINSMIKVINQILPMIDEKTKVVPGHGPLSNKAKLQQYVSMLTAIRDNVRRLMLKGQTMEEVIAAKPTRAFDEKWGNGFLPPNQFAKLVYMDLSPKLP